MFCPSAAAVAVVMAGDPTTPTPPRTAAPPTPRLAGTKAEAEVTRGPTTAPLWANNTLPLRDMAGGVAAAQDTVPSRSRSRTMLAGAEAVAAGSNSGNAKSRRRRRCRGGWGEGDRQA